MAEHKGDAIEYINIKFLGIDDSVVHFKIKKNDSLIQLTNRYCDMCGLDITKVRFLFDGESIKKDDTPSSLEMEEGNTIEVHEQQIG